MLHRYTEIRVYWRRNDKGDPCISRHQMPINCVHKKKDETSFQSLFLLILLLAKPFPLKSMITKCWLWQRWWRWCCWRWRRCSAGCLLPSSALSCLGPPDSKSMATLYLQISYLQFSISAFFCILPFPGFSPSRLVSNCRCVVVEHWTEFVSMPFLTGSQ